ncbi:protein MMS22-like [Octopus sinensis]|uniref:Protein MMS22-like n=1 Tax=Octopus sinensis TaxID=2607531 RepID=A0A6P7U1F3_9MOLL|nr:protein MMS22-like [Octopus sinensis]
MPQSNGSFGTHRVSTTTITTLPIRPLVMFVCNGEVNPNCLDDFHPESYLSKGTLKDFFQHTQVSASTSPQLQTQQKPVGFLDDDDDVCMNEVNPPVDRNTCSNWIWLFGFKYSVRTALDFHPERLFLLFRQSINHVVNNAERDTLRMGEVNSHQSRELLSQREQIKTFLDYINYYLQKYVPSSLRNDPSSDCNIPEETNNHVFLQQLFHNIQLSLQHIGPISELPRHFLQNSTCRHGSKGGSGFYHTLHMHLDIYWSTMELVFRIVDLCPDHNFEITSEMLHCGSHLVPTDEIEPDAFQRIVNFILWDLSAIACQRFSNLAFSDYTKVSPFTCTCVKEMWTMLIQVLKHRQRSRGGRAFWYSLYEVINGHKLISSATGDKTAGTIPNFYSKNELKNIPGFCIWMIFHLAPLYKLNNFGKLDTGQRYVESNYEEIVSQMKGLLAGQVSEEELQCYMLCSVQICRLWKADLTFLNVLWNYFFRKLNNTFKVNTSGLSGMVIKVKTARELFEECLELNNKDFDLATLSKGNSFHLFLYLTCQQLKAFVNDGNNSAWRNFKGRLLSKFHQRGMQELTEPGLTHFTKLFLSLTLCTHDEQLLRSLFDFYNMIDFRLADTKRQCVIIKGIYAGMSIFMHWNHDCSAAIDRIIPLLNYISSKFASDSIDVHKRRDLWDVLKVYIDCLQDLIDSSPEFTLSEYKLISKDINLILTVCHNFEICSMVVLFSAVLSKLLSLVKTQQETEGDIFIPNDHHEQMAQSMWVTAFPFVESEAKSPKALPEIADLAAQFLCLSLTLPDWSPSFSSVFSKFVCDISINVSVTCRFLGHVLAEPSVTENLETSEDQFLKGSLQIKLIHSWLRCCLLLGPVPSRQLEVVTKYVLDLPIIKRICSVVNKTDLTSECEVLIELFKMFAKAHEITVSWEDKMKLKEDIKLFFEDISISIQPLLDNPSNMSVVKHIYSTIGNLVKFCAPLLFNVPSLQQVIDCLLFPHSLFNPSKPLNPIIKSVVHDTLHLFVSGLSKISSRYAPYVQRRLKDIVLQYLPRFPLKRSGGEQTNFTFQLKPHPLVHLLTDRLVTNSICNMRNFRNFIWATLQENVLKAEGLKLPESTTIGVQFIGEVIDMTESTEDVAKDTLLLLRPLLECYLLTKTPQLRQSTTQVLNLLLKACYQYSTEVPCKELLEILNQFLTDYFANFPASLSQLWNKLFLFYPDLLQENRPVLLLLLEKLELKRGTGTDNHLRQHWLTYLNKTDKTQETVSL